MHPYFTLIPGQLNYTDILLLLTENISLQLADEAWETIQASYEVVQSIVDEGQLVYGINTGFGLLANTQISPNDLEILQRKILLSHAAGTGEYLPDKMVQLILLLKINGLAKGYSGVRPVIIERLIELYNQGIYPCIPSKGSVGASGDLAPLAHLALPLIGEGLFNYQGKIFEGHHLLAIISKPPLSLAPKEGLALINGTQVSTAIALYHLIEAKKLLQAATVIGAMSVDAAAGSIAPFHSSIHLARGHYGQSLIAHHLETLLCTSEILSAHKNCDKVQDPYSLRCQPQVLGASLDSLLHAEKILMIEANAVTDNPLVLIDEKRIISGGNFHAEPVAQVADLMAIALSEIGALSERKIALLVDPHFNHGLPAFLTPNVGINSGFMIAHVTAAALASANKSLAHPFSVDSIPTSANQEDHVSMATYAAYRLKEILDNLKTILAIELLAACQGIELRRPLHSSTPLEMILQVVRKTIPFWDEDRFFAPDIEKAKTCLILPELLEKIVI
jgi:histidine ammonia-lyase